MLETRGAHLNHNINGFWWKLQLQVFYAGEVHQFVFIMIENEIHAMNRAFKLPIESEKPRFENVR